MSVSSRLLSGLLFLFICAVPRASALVTIENRDIRLQIGDDARVLSLVYKPTGEECLAPGAHPAAFSAVQFRAYTPAKVVPAHRVRREGDRLIVSFAPLVSVATIRLRITDSYIGFTVEKVAGAGAYEQQKAWYSEYNEETQPFDELHFLQLPVRERGKYGSWLNVDWDARLAVGVVATDPYAEIGSACAPAGRMLEATLWPSVRTTPVGCALIVAPPDQVLARMDRLEQDYGLPRGARSRESSALLHSYWDISDPLTPANVTRIIGYAHAAGLGDVQVEHGALTRSGGHFPWRPEYPHGMADVRAAVQRLKAAGITAGLHIVFNKAGVNDPYVTPVPDPRLHLRRHFTLAAPLAAAGGDVRVLENPRNCTLDDKRRILRFGDELIAYRSYTTTPPYRFEGCERGALGTRPAPHAAGTIGGLLDVDSWPIWIRFNQRTDIQQEVARRIARIYHGAGFRFVYFDGSEDVPPPFWYNVAHAQWEVYRELQPEPLFSEASHLAPFDWHMMSRSTAEDAAMPEQVKAFVRERRLEQAADLALNFTRCDFGWLRLRAPGPNTIGMQPDMVEYVVGRGAGWGCPISILGSVDELAANPRTADNLEVIRRWEQARLEGWFTADQLRELRKPDPEFTLLINEHGGFELDRCEQITIGPKPGTVRAFLVHRPTGLCVSFWDIAGQSRLQLPVAATHVTLCRELGHPLPLAGGVGGAGYAEQASARQTPYEETAAGQTRYVIVPAAGRQYLEFTGLTEDAIKAAFAAATPLVAASGGR